MEEKICKNCFHYQLAENVDEGECRRFPRVSVQVGGEPKWLYPMQWNDDFCGEFEIDQ